MVMDDVNNAGRGRLQAARERQAEDQIMAFLVRQGDWYCRAWSRSTCVAWGFAIKTHLEHMSAAGRVETPTTTQTILYQR